MENNSYQYMNWRGIEAVVYGEEASPRDVMAPDIKDGKTLIQGFFPEAAGVTVVIRETKGRYELDEQDEAGYFAGLIPYSEIPEYFFEVEKKDGTKEVCYDPYAYPCLLTEEDERAFLAGVHYTVYEKLGAHFMTVNGVEGTSFAIWAPNAVRVSVVGDFNQWDGRKYPMQRMPMSGIFELFLPGIGPGTVYKYEIKTKTGEILLKADPYARQCEPAPGTASVVPDPAPYFWKDSKWMEAREGQDGQEKPICIYELDLKRWAEEKANYQNMAERILPYVKDAGYTHVELHPVMEYLEEESGGYNTSGYYAPTGRYGNPNDFRYFIDRFHQEGIGVILDWTPAHFSRHEGGMERLDGTPLYEVQNPEAAVHPKWGTLLYNYDSPLVKNFLIANGLYWLKEFHADGIRMDDVDSMLYLDYGREDGSWIPNMYGTNENLAAVEFLKHLNSIVKKQAPGVLLIAQEDGFWPQLTDSVENDHIGFDYEWNRGWTEDFLSYLSHDPIERKYYHDQLTASMLYTYCEKYVLTLGQREAGTTEEFMEKIPGTGEQKMASVRLAYGYLMTHPGKKMLAPDAEQTPETALYLKELIHLYKTCPALSAMDNSPEGFEWLQLMKAEENVITFLRKTENPEESLLVICNFAAVPHEDYKVGVPFAGKYKEILNSDHVKYGGNGVVNPRVKMARKAEWDEKPYSITVKLPALSCSVFTCTKEVKKLEDNKKAKAGETRKKAGKNLKKALAEKIQDQESKKR